MATSLSGLNGCGCKGSSIDMILPQNKEALQRTYVIMAFPASLNALSLNRRACTWISSFPPILCVFLKLNVQPSFSVQNRHTGTDVPSQSFIMPVTKSEMVIWYPVWLDHKEMEFYFCIPVWLEHSAPKMFFCVNKYPENAPILLAIGSSR